jgi:excisionase family DNA binding protein
MSKLTSARPDSPVFLTLKELAELLRVKPRTIYDWVANEKNRHPCGTRRRKPSIPARQSLAVDRRKRPEM